MYSVIIELKRVNVPFVVAPYEADAQLAYLCNIGVIDCVLSQDSDLLCFGVKKCIFKYDKNSKSKEFVFGDEINMNLLDINGMYNNDGFTFDGWLKDKNEFQNMFITMCILNGCDYCDGLPNLGIKKAYKYVTKYGSNIKNIMDAIKLEGKILVRKGYLKEFNQAFMTFKHQFVYDIYQKCVTNLNEIINDLDDVNDLGFLGDNMPDEMWQDICEGKINPITHERFRTDNEVMYIFICGYGYIVFEFNIKYREI